MRGPLVSVIIPVHNGERFLESAINSVLAQTYSPVELIVVDDGSSDDSGRIAQAFGQVVYVHQSTLGSAAARNTGLKLATGEVIAFLDHDDEMLPNKLAIQVGYLLDHPDVDCVLARQRVELAPGGDAPGWVKRGDRSGGNDQPVALSAVVRRDAIRRAGDFDPNYIVSHDMDWLFRLRQHGARIEILPETVMLRRFHGSNLSYAGRLGHQELLRAVGSRIEARRNAGDKSQKGIAE